MSTPPINSDAYTTLENLKPMINVAINNTADDPMLTRLILAASSLIDRFCNRSFTLQSYTEIRNGNGKNRLVLKNAPIVTVTQVVVNGVGYTQMAEPAVGVFASNGATFAFEEQQIVLVGGRFIQGVKNVLIQYTAGFDPVPDDVEQACIDIVTTIYKNKDRFGEISKVIQGIGTVSFSQKDMTAFAAEVLYAWQLTTPVTGG
jgi:hypothetical protein